MDIQGRPISIQEEDVKLFMEYIAKGMTQRQAAKAAGYSLAGFRIAMNKYGYSMPRKSLAKRMSERINEIKNSTKTQKWWANEFNVSQPAFNQALKGFKKEGKIFYNKKPGPAVDHEKKLSEYRQILEYIQRHGGYIPEAIKALGLSTNKHYVRQFAKRIGFNLTNWRYAWREYGLWLTLPGPWKKLPPANHLVPAVCRGCGEFHNLNLCNAKSGRTNGCQQCAQAAREFLQVINNDTGEIYSSVMAWVKSMDKMKDYQKLRLKIRAKSSVVIDGVQYSIISE